jgi:predicted nucleic acid-binding protein
VSLVLDASVTLAWLYDDERTDAVEQAFEAAVASGAWVPAIWPLEIANGLQQGVQRKRIDHAYRDGALADLIEIAINIDPETNIFAWTVTLELADRFHLTVYDACYLELAQRHGLPLASLDRQLREAGQALGIKLLGV